jgi:protein involved in temperature-dependent protein secretion
MLDLEQTEQFCLFREAKTCLYNGATGSAEVLFRQYIAISPVNILARYFLAKCCVANGKWADAEHQLKTAIRIGSLRRPPLQLIRVRRELERVRRQRPDFIGAMRRLFLAERRIRETITTEESERRALNRSINRLAMERLRERPLRGEIGGKAES